MQKYSQGLGACTSMKNKDAKGNPCIFAVFGLRILVPGRILFVGFSRIQMFVARNMPDSKAPLIQMFFLAISEVAGPPKGIILEEKGFLLART